MLHQRSLLAIVVALLLSTSAPAATIPVLNSFDTATIQGLITGSTAGDVLQFQAGTYTLTSELLVDKAITLQGLGGAAGTILQRDTGSASNHRILFIDGTISAASATVDGFTIANGVGSLGGNVYVYGSPDAVIKNSIIENGAGGNGGGIQFNGGGILLDSVVRNNAASDFGGGVYFRNGGTLVENSLIYGNSAAAGGGIGGQYGTGATAPYATQIVHSTIAQNTTTGFFGYHGSGVGVQLPGGPGEVIIDSIIYDNSPDNFTPTNGGVPTITYTASSTLLSGGTGNQAGDPQFVGIGPIGPTDDPWEFFALQASSPLIDTSSTGNSIGAIQFTVNSPVPEPSCLVLLGCGLLLLSRRRVR